MTRFWKIYFAILASIAFPISAQVRDMMASESILRGKTGVSTEADLNAVWLNPAQAALFPDSTVGINLGLVNYKYTYRYPNFAATSKSETKLDPGIPLPHFVYKASSRLGLSGVIIPFAVNQDIEANELPIVVLTQPNNVNLIGTGTLNLFLELTGGYRVSKATTLGLRAHYSSFDASGKLVPSDGGGDEIASFQTSQSVFMIGFGALFRFSQFRLGFATHVLQQTNEKSEFSQLGNNDSEPSSNSSTEFFNPIRLGVSYIGNPKTQGHVEMSYKRKRENVKRSSVKDFKSKPLDNYDTVSLFTGIHHDQSASTRILGGFFYQPSSVGPGDSSEDGRTGFGFLDIALNLGAPPARPVWGFGGGARYYFGNKPTKGNIDEESTRSMHFKKQRKKYLNMTAEFGLVYSETSIGVGSTGEQPAAYLVKRYHLPLKFTYQF